MPERAPFIALLVNFTAELRSAGLSVGSGDVLAYCAAAGALDPTDLLDLYWGGRTTLVTRRESIPVYDRVFRRFFLDSRDPVRELLNLQHPEHTRAEGVLQIPATDPGEDLQEQVSLGLVASDAETLRHKSFPACTPEELAALRRIMARIRLTPPRRRTRRTTTAAAGRAPDLRRMVRQSLRMHGEPPELAWRRRKVRLRPLILILDVSGSMADYSRHLLQFAYSAKRATARVEVFCFGTRLTRITRALDHRKPDDALERAAGAWCSTGRAAPGSGPAWTPSCATGAAAGCAAAGSWSSAPTGWTGVTRSCWPRRWNGCGGSVTGWCG